MNSDYLIEITVVDQVTRKPIARKLTDIQILEEIDYDISIDIKEQIKEYEGRHGSSKHEPTGL